jgi:hypothetical protein
MKYAKRIASTIAIPDSFRASVVLGEHGMTEIYPKGRVIRKYLPKKYADRIQASLPLTVQPYFLGANFSEIRLLAPHIHLKEQCVINHYIKTNGEVTKFYEGEFVRDDSYSLDNGNGYLNIDISKVHEVEEFIAGDGDTWVLCTEQPHSVSYVDARQGIQKYEPVNDSCRSIIQIYVDAPFDFVTSQFKEAE